MTSFDIAAITPELNQQVTGAYIDNIYQTSPRTLLLRLRQPGRPRLHLLIEAGKRLHLTSYVLEKPTRPSSFCMALRKYLRNGVVTAISQHRFERIVILKVTTKGRRLPTDLRAFWRRKQHSREPPERNPAGANLSENAGSKHSASRNLPTRAPSWKQSPHTQSPRL